MTDDRGDDQHEEQRRETGDADPVDQGRRQVSAWLWRVPVLLAVAGGGFGVYEAIRIHFDKQRPDPTPSFDPVPPTRVATVGAFGQPWDAVPFTLAGIRGQRNAALPAIAVRLPSPIPGGLDFADPDRGELNFGDPDLTDPDLGDPDLTDPGLGDPGQAGADGQQQAVVHLAAFSRVCTHQGCIVDFNTDLAAIDFGFNYGSDHPALTCPCHLSVFDPALAGRVVSGPAVRPLPRVSLRVQDGEVWADGVERD